MKVAAIIVAAGRGIRAGGDLPKQWQPLAGRRVIDWTIEAFQKAKVVDQIVLVLHPDDLTRYSEHGKIRIVSGGATRAQSVRKGLTFLNGTDISHVLIHDAARPCTQIRTIEDIVATLSDHSAVAPALPVTDALWYVRDGLVSGAQDRAGLFRAQTPQGFERDKILCAHQTFEGDAVDDVQVARAAGIDVKIIDGHEDNLKITIADDFARADKILRGQMDIRVGSGYDVHRFGRGDHVMLCGISVPHGRGLQGHSDADVGMHALTDALYGAIAAGDIGRHFPPSDPKWKGAESHIFLRHATRMVAEKGFSISNMDITQICEEPKIGPHAAAMQSALSEITGVALDRVSVKATTSERLGFTGRGEGIAAQAVVTLVQQ